MIDTRWLNDFLTTAETKNFSRAAEMLNSTQPAVSRRIHALEEWLGARLFNRDTQPVSLTPEGELFKPAAEEILRTLRRVQSEVRGLQKRAPSVLRIITTHGLATTVVPAWLSAIEAVAGVISIRLETAWFDDCAAAMMAGTSDLMLAYTHPMIPLPLDPKAFPSIVIERDRLMPVSAPDERGRPRHPVPGSSASHPSGYLAYTLSSGFGRLLDRWLRRREESLHLIRVFESHLAGLLKIMAREGRGVAWLAARDVTADVAAGRLVRAGPQELSLELEVRMFRPAGAMSPIGEHIWNAATKLAEETIR
jgi:LysR family transcriptional regulator, hypochlorite-specific transcription factor HypT